MAFLDSIKILRQTSAIQKNLERYHSRFLAVFSIMENRSKNILSFEIYHLSSSFEKLVTACC
ncbi:hypothetical protein FJN11_06150 [Streptococcus symci]|uniref:Uncharacterized protein n=1 Tax=Streptococcus symci TaxID=2588991 RepID=A0A501P9Z3_9STRE|nr:hypothetical protein CBI42_09960 [Streptococcus sp. KR]TPD57143.1 hypothetical protein FJN11_06150 [Streptococcus symci]